MQTAITNRLAPPFNSGATIRSRGAFLLSRPGYSRKASRAIINVNSHPFGTNAGSGTTYLLEKENGVWKVIDSRLSWIS